jgi:hypothetical protein
MRILTLIALLALPATAPAAAILDNGSFEFPNVGGTYQSFATGANVGVGGAWKSVATGGASGSVAVVSGSSASGGFTLNAQSGAQWLDLTGDGANTTLGVQQTFPTTVDGNYTLSFSIGNVVNAGGSLGTTSSVRVYIDDMLVDTFSNNLGSGSSGITWLSFSVPFTAATGTTTVKFINDDAATDNLNGLDNVSVVRRDTQVGGGGIGFSVLALLAALGWRRRRV